MDSTDNISEEMSRQFDYLRDEIKTINERQSRIQGTIIQLCGLFGLKKPKDTESNKEDDKKTETESSSSFSKF